MKLSTDLTIQELATQYSYMFQLSKRANGEEYYIVKPKYSLKPEYHECNLYKLIRTAHGDLMPNDYSYCFIVEALHAIAEHEGDDIFECESPESDIYTSELTAWLASNNHRMEYLGEAIQEQGSELLCASDLLGRAQWWEKKEVFESVCGSLRDELEEIK